MNWKDVLRDEPIDLEPRPGFETQLRDGLVGEWNGRPIVTPEVPAQPTSRSPHRGWLMAAVAALMLIGGVVIVTRSDAEQTLQTPATELAPPTVAENSTVPPVQTATGPPTTAPPTTAPATTLPPTSAVPTTVLTPDPVPALLEDWPAPSTAPGNLNAVPFLLPADIQGATDVLRSEFASAPIEIYDYIQTWIVDDGSGYLEITTNIAQFDGTPLESRTAVDIDGWDDAYFARSTPEFANLRLVSSDGVVWVSQQGLGRERVMKIAQSMTRRPNGKPGWSIDDAGLTLFNEGGDVAQASRSVQFKQDESLIAELTISDRALNGAPINWFAENTIEFVDIDGQPAVATDNGFVTAVSWSLGDGTGVLFGFRGPIDDALAVARTIAPVDQAAWDSQTIQDPSLRDGCDSLFC